MIDAVVVVLSLEEGNATTLFHQRNCRLSRRVAPGCARPAARQKLVRATRRGGSRRTSPSCRSYCDKRFCDLLRADINKGVVAPLPLLAQQRAAISCGTAGACRSGLLAYGAAPDHVCPSLVSGCEMRPSSRRPNVWSRRNLFAPCAAGHRWVAAGGRTLCYCERSAPDKQRDDRQTFHGSHLQPPMFTPHSPRRRLKTRVEDCLFQVNKKERRTSKRLPAVLLINWVSQCPFLEGKADIDRTPGNVR